MNERNPQLTYRGPERRSSQRIKASQPLPGELALDLETDVLKLSSNGMLVRLPFPLTVGSHHRFTLVVEEAVVEVDGVVRNCQSLQENWPAFGVGVEFENVTEPSAVLLERFVQAKLKR